MKKEKKRSAPSKTKRPPLTILLFEDDGAWLAQALERDIASSGTTPMDAIAGLCASVSIHLKHDARLKLKPLSHLPRAPERFFTLAKLAWPTSPPRLPRMIGSFEPRIRWVSGEGAAASV